MDVREKLVELLKQTEINKINGHTALAETCFTPNVFENMATNLITHGVTVREWTSVKDRLPEESGMYIVTANDGHAQRVSFVLWQKKNRMWNLTGARSYWRVTHWLPLPQPPKGE